MQIKTTVKPDENSAICVDSHLGDDNPMWTTHDNLLSITTYCTFTLEMTKYTIPLSLLTSGLGGGVSLVTPNIVSCDSSLRALGSASLIKWDRGGKAGGGELGGTGWTESSKHCVELIKYVRLGFETRFKGQLIHGPNQRPRFRLAGGEIYVEIAFRR